MAGAAGSLILFLSIASPTPEEVQRAAAEVFEGDRYQTRLPGEGQGAGVVPSPTDWERDLDRATGRSLRPARVPDAVAGVARALVYVVGAVFVLLIAGWFWSEWRASRSRSPAPPPILPASPALAVEAPLPDAERLFREGLIAEAIHALLLACLRELPSLPPAATSRELLAGMAPNDGARAALAQLVRAVELSRFGGRTPHEADYRAGVESRQRFRAARAAA